MLYTPVAPSRQVIAQLRTQSVERSGLKVSMYLAPCVRARDVTNAVADCWERRPRSMAPMMLHAVLQHLRSSAIDLLELRRHETTAIACFALVDGSVHEDTWIEHDLSLPTLVNVAPRFHLRPFDHIATRSTTDAPAPERKRVLVLA